MSLRDLKDEIYLILQIKEGYSFGFTTSPLIITANLAGNIHESFIVDPSPQPKFQNEFVWVMDKTKMKNIWAEKLPVRIECFSVNQSHRSRIGYIILNVKDAQIAQNEAKITEKQLRLLGLSREASLLKPELVLSFHITDVPIQSSQLIPQFSPRLEGPRVEVTSEPMRVTLGSGRDHFTLNISVANKTNLGHLLPSQAEPDVPAVSYCYNMLGRELVSQSGVQLCLVSSLACLKTYVLRNPTVNVTVSAGSIVLGHTTITLESLVVWEDGAARRTKPGPKTVNSRCSVSPALPVAVAEGDVWIEFSLTLVMESTAIKKKPSAPNLSSVGAGGDADNTRLTLPLKTPVTPRLTSKSLPSLTQGEKSGGETYRTQQPSTSHTVVVNIMSLQLDSPQTATQMWLTLSQPSATVSPSEPLPVPQPWLPLQYQLCVTLPSHLIHSTLASQPASLQLRTADTILATASLSPALDNSTTQTELRGGSGHKVGVVNVTWTTNQSPPPDLTSQSAPADLISQSAPLADLTSQSAPTLTDTSLSPPTRSHPVGVEVLSPRSRELKILSFVEELEDWAEKQRTIIMEGLKEEEAARLASLQAQWEAEVGGQVSEGRQLLQALQSMRDQLKQQEDQLRDNQFKLKVYKEELERVHRSKLQEFKDLSRRMQDEFNHKLTLIASDKVALEREVEQLKAENLEMKQKCQEAEHKYNSDKRSIDDLTHEMTVLKEKLNMEVESKRFFKEHCRKAEQEIHRLNCLRQQEMEARLLSDKKSLEHLAFQQIIVEKNDLRQDQALLNEIRQQLLRAPTVGSDSNGGTLYTERTSDDRHIRRAT